MTVSNRIIIDGTTYNVPVQAISRKAEFLDKYAKRVESGDLKRKLIGVYLNYEIEFGNTLETTTYHNLWNVLTAPTEFHSVTVPADDGDFSFTAYFADVSDEMVAQHDGKNYFGSLKASFIAKEPTRTPA